MKANPKKDTDGDAQKGRKRRSSKNEEWRTKT